MSYILDALRRADSERERERGGVPGLNAQPVPAGSLDAGGSRRGKAWIWVAIGITLGLAVPLAWRFLGSHEAAAPEAPTGARAAVSGQVLPPPAPPVDPAATPVPPISTQASDLPGAPRPAPPVATAPPAAPPPIQSPPRPVTAKAAVATARPTTGLEPGRTAPPATRPAAQAPARAAPPPAAPVATPLPRLAELPEDVRRDVPSLAFGGSIYSELPKQRMVILNGQVLREGDAITGELAVDEIRPKSAVLRIRDRRFELVF